MGSDCAWATHLLTHDAKVVHGEVVLSAPNKLGQELSRISPILWFCRNVSAEVGWRSKPWSAGLEPWHGRWNRVGLQPRPRGFEVKSGGGLQPHPRGWIVRPPRPCHGGHSYRAFSLHPSHIRVEVFLSLAGARRCHSGSALVVSYWITFRVVTLMCFGIALDIS